MREIKFRGKRVDSGDFIYGIPINPYGKQWAMWIRDKAYPVGIDPATIGQYTGLKDKNGREIFEGDVVQAYIGKHRHGKYEIHYIGRSFCMAQEPDDTEMDCVWFCDFEVIGNIHDAPELLEERK